ncbi:protein CFAP107 [Girardinichthys multiradiatus]|uniref:protein CFAP107 n=1 Tax=Girardinichthys multiradiatus TaxID=208333 RepID=UPI001FAD3269|nr:protein CFAP107 [Girardinichthys multiradiatus]
MGERQGTSWTSHQYNFTREPKIANSTSRVDYRPHWDFKPDVFERRSALMRAEVWFILCQFVSHSAGPLPMCPMGFTCMCYGYPALKFTAGERLLLTLGNGLIQAWDHHLRRPSRLQSWREVTQPFVFPHICASDLSTFLPN